MKVKFPLEDRIAYVNCRSFHAESANIQNDIFTVRFVYFIILSKRAKSIHFYSFRRPKVDPGGLNFVHPSSRLTSSMMPVHGLRFMLETLTVL